MPSDHSTNPQIHLVSRPTGEAGVDNFRLVEAAVPALADGEVLVRNHYLSLDPYMRMRMNDAKSYAAPQALNTVMLGGTVGEVVASRHPSTRSATRWLRVAAGSTTRWSTRTRSA